MDGSVLHFIELMEYEANDMYKKNEISRFDIYSKMYFNLSCSSEQYNSDSDPDTLNSSLTIKMSCYDSVNLKKNFIFIKLLGKLQFFVFKR